MLNPTQISYTPVELFYLKPDSIQVNIETLKPESVNKSGTSLPDPAPIAGDPSFWSSHKWLIIGGVVVVGGFCWYVYKKNQKNKSKQTN